MYTHSRAVDHPLPMRLHSGDMLSAITVGAGEAVRAVYGGSTESLGRSSGGVQVGGWVGDCGIGRAYVLISDQY